MNVNITGIYDNTVIVDTNLFEDVRLLQTGLSSLSDTLFNVVEGKFIEISFLCRSNWLLSLISSINFYSNINWKYGF